MTDILNILQGGSMVKICAPMVRYSKLPFRSLVRKYDCDLCFTPMIMADSFVKSAKSRDIEFSTNQGDNPLVVQFAANNVPDFVTSAEMVSPYSNGVDLNCGCPQRWAMSDGYGADLLTKPQIVKDMVLQVRNRISRPFTVSVKIRILDDMRKTIDLCQTLESAGVSFLTVHARTPQQKHQPVNMNAFREIRDRVQLPLIANGDVKTLAGAKELHEITGYQGIMAARGMLTNPAMFAGYARTPIDCVQHWVNIAMQSRVPFKCLHHHLVFMMEKLLPKRERSKFNCLKSTESVLEFLGEHYGIVVEKRGEDFEDGSVFGCEADDERQGSYFMEKAGEDSEDESTADVHLEGSFDIFIE